MLDFLRISTRTRKNGAIEVYPKFKVGKSSDLMIRGGDFYAIWLEERGLWSTDEQDVIDLIDRELDKYANEHRHEVGDHPIIMHMWDSETGTIDQWHRYCQKQQRDSYVMLDEKLIFSNMETGKKDYASKRLPYPLEEGSIEGFDKLISTLYDPEERHKIEWAIGSIVSGASKSIQKFMVLYGSAGTGKSTILNIIQQLFEGYYSVFDAKALGSANNSFALEPFKCNPLIAIQHDGDLSRIEDNTRLNSLVSHELMTVNEKFKSAYTNRFKCFLFMGTNKPVRITDAKSGLIRRLIDVSPSGNKLSQREYDHTMRQIKFELGAIANHCLNVYLDDPNFYDNYVPVKMMGASNDFYNFVVDSYHIFKKEDGVTLKVAWEMYKNYCDDAKVAYPYSMRLFKEELKNYFRDHKERMTLEDDSRVRNYYVGFRTDKFETERPTEDKKQEEKETTWLKFEPIKSVFDDICGDCPAQYATAVTEIPNKKWENVRTRLEELDTSKLHYVKVPETHIVIDFDIPDESGQKCLAKNIEEASKWPPTYAELSKSGEGVHLHYIYTGGDPSLLGRIYEEHIEVKVFTGKSSLRRKLSKCNDLPIATISSGLPLKGDKKMVNFEGVKSEKALRTSILKALNKEVHPATKPNIDFIHMILDKAYSQGLKYDVSDLESDILSFAMDSTHQADYCVKLVSKMRFKSEEMFEATVSNEPRIVFYDIEVFPNLFLVNWKFRGKDKPVVRMINPSPRDMEDLMQFDLVGFNNRRYDNHLIYARMLGYDNAQLYDLSQRIIGKKEGAFFSAAFDISYTDVYDFASAGNKKGLKKWEIELGIHHQELGLPWDQPVPEELWPKVAEYCDNDVIATEAVFEHLSADWTARLILADLAEGKPNDTTNSLSTRIIFDREKRPQHQFNYRNMAEPVKEISPEMEEWLTKNKVMNMPFDEHSVLPYFPGYKYEFGKSTYRGIEVGEGGYVYAEHAIHCNVALLDVASMHPHSVIAEVLFGVAFTTRFKEIVDGRVSIKHEAWEEVSEMLNGKLKPYIQKVLNGEMTSKQLADALKTAINSVYGLTAASFDNPFRDRRNIDNIVAKRGALFMIDLQFAVQEKGFTVAHIKTDSIKIPDATPDIIGFVMAFGRRYGYTFEHEATYDRMCLVNNAVYIAKYATAEKCEALYGYVPGDNKKKGGKWTATGTQFAVPYVFKSLFSKEDILFEDMCETKQVTSSLYLDMNEELPDVVMLENERAKLSKEIRNAKSKLNTMTEGREAAEAKIRDRIKELDTMIAKGHDYHFVGRVGSFCPVKAGRGGGILVRESGTDPVNDILHTYASATGADGYRWMEAEMIQTLNKEMDIDRSYYDNLVINAVNAISELGDFEWFVSDCDYMGVQYDEKGAPIYDCELPF
jgi:hypothetical protein